MPKTIEHYQQKIDIESAFIRFCTIIGVDPYSSDLQVVIKFFQNLIIDLEDKIKSLQDQINELKGNV